MGRSYVIEHCITALKQYNEERIYKNYVTSALQYIVNNTANQESKIILQKSYNDIMNPPNIEDEKKSEQKADDIIDRMKAKLGSL